MRIQIMLKLYLSNQGYATYKIIYKSFDFSFMKKENLKNLEQA